MKRRTRGSTIAERLAHWTEVDPSTGCHLWAGGRNNVGYALVSIPGRDRKRTAHRAAYELAKGPIPAGMTLDHLCRVRHCINPDHLEAVTQAENNRRAREWRRTATHCPAGHEYVDTWRRCLRRPSMKVTGRLADAGIVSMDVRRWAWANDLPCLRRGRIPNATIDAYLAAQHARAAA